MTNIVVFGSINMDVINEVHRQPLPGETIKGLGVQYSPGGKGANQAVAAAKLGGSVKLVGAVGTDEFGKTLLQALKPYVDVDYICKKEGSSGLAFITVDKNGENTIILDEGANGKLLEEDVERVRSVFDQTDLILLQNEVPWPVNLAVLGEARKRQIPVFFNPAPAMKVDKDVFSLIQLLVLNETEAEYITGLQDPEASVETLINLGVREIALTLGEQGLIYKNNHGTKLKMPAFNVKAMDTTAAGDTFIGALSSVYLTGDPMEEKFEFASAAAALAITKKGAQNSIPSRLEVNQFRLQRS